MKIILTLQFLFLSMLVLQNNAQYFSEPERALLNRIGKKSYDTFNLQAENTFEPRTKQNGASQLSKLLAKFDSEPNRNHFDNKFEELFDQISEMNKLKARLDNLIWKDLIIGLKKSQNQ
jgi:hypothetical protein